MKDSDASLLNFSVWRRNILISRITRLSILLIILNFTGFSCRREKETEISFYHWKSKAVYTEAIQEAIHTTKTRKIYMHYFDVDFNRADADDQRDLYPVYTLTEVSPEFVEFDIIPVVFIVNQALKDVDVQELGSRIHRLIDQISKYQFKRECKIIQLDCDWTSSTRDHYFSLIRYLHQYYEVSTTIRLHQIKYAQKTGVPPVDQGTLMLYNMGHLDSTSENSIIDASLVSEYINNTTTYPIPLDVALPLFSQTVIKSKEKQIRIIPGVERESLALDTLHFQKINDHLFTVIRDTLYKGFYLSPGYTLKLEDSSENEIIHSYDVLRESRLDLKDIIFYHLDDDALRQINLNELILQL